MYQGVVSEASQGSGVAQKSELLKYLNALDIEDLEMITKDRRSTKKNENGPIIYGEKSPWGKPKIGHSIPQHLKINQDHEYGLSSYHRGQASELK